jgi:uncharacterized membrane protein YidH (DUF202 family)
MKILRLCATLFSFGIVALGMLGIASPSVLLELAQSLLVPPALYGVAAVRIVFGVLLLAVAGEARMPRALRVLGAFIVLAGMLTPFVGVLPFDQALAWFSKHGLGLFRLVATLPVIAGIFFVYAIHPARPTGGDGAA